VGLKLIWTLAVNRAISRASTVSATSQVRPG